MRHTYSGFGQDTKKPRGGISVWQLISAGVLLVMFVLMFMRIGGDGGTQADRELSNVNIRFYYYVKAEVDYSLVYVDRQILLDGGNGILSAFEKGMKHPPEGREVYKTIANEAFINYITTDGKTVTVDFNSALITYGMDYAREAAMLMAITHTMADYFNVSRVAVTVDGGPYTSGNYEFDEGYFMETRNGEANKY